MGLMATPDLPPADGRRHDPLTRDLTAFDAADIDRVLARLASQGDDDREHGEEHEDRHRQCRARRARRRRTGVRLPGSG